MKKVSCLVVIALAFISSVSHAQNFNGFIGPFHYSFGNNKDGEAPPDVELADAVKPIRITKDFILSKFDDGVINKFHEAWQSTGNGTTAKESVILILRMADGTYSARSQGTTNEYKSFTFHWHPATVAIVHTHPNNTNPKPQQADIVIADKLGVLMFTITSRGMYLYDPATKKLTKILNGLDWLERSSWAKVRSALKTE